MKIRVEPRGFMPARGQITDAGLNIRSMDDGVVRARQSAVFHTGIHVKLPRKTAGLFVSCGNLMMRHEITSTGLVDQGSDGEVLVKLFNHGDTDHNVKRGDTIAQLVVLPAIYEPVEIVNSARS